MKRRIFLAGPPPLIALMAWACAVNPGPGEVGYPYNLSGSYRGAVIVEDLSFALTMDLVTRAEGTLAGEYWVTEPVVMSGPVTGSTVADSVTFSLNYVNPMDGCSGFLQGDGTIETGGGSFSGRARINDSCNGVLTATFAMRK
jgi:hypothetical protein